MDQQVAAELLQQAEELVDSIEAIQQYIHEFLNSHCRTMAEIDRLLDMIDAVEEMKPETYPLPFVDFLTTMKLIQKNLREDREKSLNHEWANLTDRAHVCQYPQGVDSTWRRKIKQLLSFKKPIVYEVADNAQILEELRIGDNFLEKHNNYTIEASTALREIIYKFSKQAMLFGARSTKLKHGTMSRLRVELWTKAKDMERYLGTWLMMQLMDRMIEVLGVEHAMQTAVRRSPLATFKEAIRTTPILAYSPQNKVYLLVDGLWVMKKEKKQVLMPYRGYLNWVCGPDINEDKDWVAAK